MIEQKSNEEQNKNKSSSSSSSNNNSTHIMLHVNAPILCPVYIFCVPRIFTLVNKVESLFKVNMNSEHTTHSHTFIHMKCGIASNAHIYMHSTLTKCTCTTATKNYSHFLTRLLYLWRLLNLQLYIGVYIWGIPRTHTRTRTFQTHFFHLCICCCV